jgi:hypothetical protein
MFQLAHELFGFIFGKFDLFGASCVALGQLLRIQHAHLCRPLHCAGKPVEYRTMHQLAIKLLLAVVVAPCWQCELARNGRVGQSVSRVGQELARTAARAKSNCAAFNRVGRFIRVDVDVRRQGQVGRIGANGQVAILRTTWWG